MELRRLLPAVALFAFPLGATVISPGLYRLANHPDGAIRPPMYGLRLDEMVNATAGHDNFTFDFDHANSAMWMTWDGAGAIHIFGLSHGGRDIGGAYANDIYLGVYGINFVYNVRVGPVPGDDDIWVATYKPNNPQANKGAITLPMSAGGTSIGMIEEAGNFAYSFRLGDEDNDLGHRGFPGISGWGWLDLCADQNCNTIRPHVYAQDWLFTAHFRPDDPIPEPASLMLMGAGLLGLAVYRRRRA